jgi:hypothetical protein
VPIIQTDPKTNNPYLSGHAGDAKDHRLLLVSSFAFLVSFGS